VLVRIVLFRVFRKLLLQFIGHRLAAHSRRIPIILVHFVEKLVSGLQEKGWHFFACVLRALESLHR